MFGSRNRLAFVAIAMSAKPARRSVFVGVLVLAHVAREVQSPNRQTLAVEVELVLWHFVVS